MDPKRASLLRQLPQVDDLLRHPELAPAVSPLPRLLAAAVVRRVLAAARHRINAAPPAALPPSLDETALLQDLREALLAAAKPRLRRVVNATGVVIHTNLGRSPLGEACLASLLEVASRYNTTPQELQKLNKLTSKNLKNGQVLLIPPGHAPAKTASTPKAKVKNYKVKSGDTPSVIARKYDMEISEFLKLNKLSQKSTIKPGQVVQVIER